MVHGRWQTTYTGEHLVRVRYHQGPTYPVRSKRRPMPNISAFFPRCLLGMLHASRWIACWVALSCLATATTTAREAPTAGKKATSGSAGLLDHGEAQSAKELRRTIEEGVLNCLETSIRGEWRLPVEYLLKSDNYIEVLILLY